MTHLLIVLLLALFLVLLLRARLIQIDLFFPWFAALAVLGFASTSPRVVDWLGRAFGILYAPIAVIFLVFFLQLGIIVSLTIVLTRLRERVSGLAKHEALRSLAEQEATRARGSSGSGAPRESTLARPSVAGPSAVQRPG